MSTLGEMSLDSLPLDEIADAARQRAADLGANHADIRIENTTTLRRRLRDLRTETSANDRSAGMGVRVIADGAWGFAADSVIGVDGAARLAERAVELARVAAPLTATPVELAPEPGYPGGRWASAYRIDPLDVPDGEITGRLADLSAALLDGDGVDHADASLTAVSEDKYYADSHGTTTRQYRVRVHPQLTAVSVGEHGFASMRTLAPPAGRGWENLLGEGWDFDSEIAEMPALLAEHAAAPSVEAGRYDLVIDPTNLWLTIHESVAHATELDRALGYEAAYAGTSFATLDQLGSLRYGSAAMTVTGDRLTEHGLATVGWDDEGVAAGSFDIIKDGVLVGYQLDRQLATRAGQARSNGCAFADSAGHIPLQRMPNVSLTADPAGPSTAELIARVDDGIFVLGDNSWSIDMQRYNFQFTGQRFYRIRGGQLAGQVRDVAYQATTTDFWRSLEAVGGPDTYLLGGAFNCGKGQPGQVAPVSHGAPAGLFRGVNVLNTVAEGGAA